MFQIAGELLERDRRAETEDRNVATLKAHGFDHQASVEIAALHRADELAQQVGRLERELAQFRAEYLGKGVTPQPGCRIATVSLEDADVLVEFEFQAEEAPNYDADSRGAGPGCPASVSVLNILVNGKWIDPHGYVADEVIERWEEELCEEAVS